MLTLAFCLAEPAHTPLCRHARFATRYERVAAVTTYLIHIAADASCYIGSLRHAALTFVAEQCRATRAIYAAPPRRASFCYAHGAYASALRAHLTDI